MKLLAYDLVLRRPGCVLVAAALGADTTLPSLFPIGSWLLAPTPDIQVYAVSDADLAQAVAATEGGDE